MKKESRAMDSQWALEVMHKAPYMTVSFIDEDGKPYGLPQHMDAFDPSIARSLSRTAVVRITLTEPPTGKRKQYDKEGVEMKYGRME